MTAIETKLVSLDEFLAMPSPTDGSRLELIRGEVVEMPPTQGDHGIICGNFSGEIYIYLKSHPIGWMATNDTGTILEIDPDTMRGPDVGFGRRRGTPIVLRVTLNALPTWRSKYYHLRIADRKSD